VWLKNYSRIIVLFAGAIACAALNFWLIMTGHYRMPLFIFISYIVAVPLILRKLPVPTRDPEQINPRLLKASSSARRQGFLYIFCFAMAILAFFRREFKQVPTWGVVLMFLWGVFWIWIAFWRSKWYKDKASAAVQATREESK
jgi:RsiW-degrading membrane proteinase PrsW (M82 family)